MAHPRSTFWPTAIAPLLLLLLMIPRPAQAVPAFARKFGVKCYTCHTIPPALNKNGYTFKRLGYRMPPEEMDASRSVPKVKDLDKAIRFNVMNSLAVVGQGSFSQERTQGEGAAAVSHSKFNLDEVAVFAAGAVPASGFSYFTQLDLSQDGGTPFLEQAVFSYTAGRANRSYFVKAGQMHVQEGEGTRAAMFYNLFPEPAPLLTASSPVNFSLDQHPLAVAAGYTWASSYFKRVFAITAKVNNGLRPDGSELLYHSARNTTNLWLDADYWFGPDGGVTFMTYYGKKDQLQNQGESGGFTFRPTLRRYGLFANYLFFDKLDLLGGYLRSDDDWQAAPAARLTRFTSDGFRAEADYYIQRGFAVMARYDRMNQTLAGAPAQPTAAWNLGVSKALTARGNVLARASYGRDRLQDPEDGAVTTSRLFKLDLRLMW